MRLKRGRRGERGRDGARGAGRPRQTGPWNVGGERVRGGVVTGAWGFAVERLSLQLGTLGEWEFLLTPLRRLCSPGEMETSSRTFSLLGP